MAVAFLSVVGSFGCGSDSIVAPGITAAQLCARQDSAIAAQPVPTINDLFDMMAGLLPGGFAGLAVDAWYLQQPALADTARATAAVLAACPGARAPNLWQIVQSAPSHGVAYSWLQLRSWSQQLLAGGGTGLVASGIDVVGNRVAITVRTQQDVDAWRARARSLSIPEVALSITISDLSFTRLAHRPSNER